MSLKTKSRADGHQATPDISNNSNNSNTKRYCTRFADQLKTVVVTLTAWGWFPICIAEKLTKKRGGDYE